MSTSGTHYILVSKASFDSEDEHDIIDEIYQRLDRVPSQERSRRFHPDAIKAYLINHYWFVMSESCEARFSDYLFNTHPTFSDLDTLYQGLLDIEAPGNASLIKKALTMVEPFRAFDDGVLSITTIAGKQSDLYDELFGDDTANHQALMQMGREYENLLAYEDLIWLLSTWLKKHPQLKLIE